MKENEADEDTNTSVDSNIDSNVDNNILDNFNNNVDNNNVDNNIIDNFNNNVDNNIIDNVNNNVDNNIIDNVNNNVDNNIIDNVNNIIDNKKSVYEIRKQRRKERLQQSLKEPMEPKMSPRPRRKAVRKETEIHSVDSPVSTNNSESIISTNNELKKEHIINDSKMKQKDINVLKNVKDLLCNICKNNAEFIIQGDYTIKFYKKPYMPFPEYVIKINNIKINNKTTLYDIYIGILESYSDDYDFNINITYGKRAELDANENVHSRYFGLIPIYDENANNIVFYEDNESINNYLKSITKITDKKSIEIYSNLEKLCELKKKTHSMATKHYVCMNKYFLVPSIVLSSSSGIVSFLASSEYFKDYNLIFTISVGVASSITTLFQSFSNAFEFSTKAEAHQNAAESYDQLLTQIRFEKMSPNSNSETFINTIEKQILDTKQRCKYIVPEFIETEYNEHKFNNYKEYVLKDLLKKFITLKSELYFNSIKDTSDFEKINFKEIEKKLGFDDIKDHDDWCKKGETSPNSCCCL